ncbi:MAG TPA: (2Fe-2S)-binding protein [Atopostipes sp.]|nr:(2Fe-2S)-binding protein [Atopostipes sp.]
MKSNRITNHPVLGDIEPRNVISFTFDGKTYSGYEGDTIASALLANGIRQLRVHEETGHPRGIYCNIGHCFECRVTADGEKGIRACMTPIRPDMVVESGQMEPDPLKSEDGATDLPRTYAEFEKRYKRTEGDSDV